MNSQFVNYVLINNIPEKQYKRMTNSAGSECSGPSSNLTLPLTNCDFGQGTLKDSVSSLLKGEIIIIK